MGISKNFPVADGPSVVQGLQVTRSIYTDKGFNAGDYVYSYNNGSVGNNPNIGAALPGGPIYNVIGGANGGSWGSGTSFSTANIVSPTLIGATYSVTYPTVTFATNYLSSTNTFNDTASWTASVAALTNGNTVIVYTNTSNNVVFKIYNNTGVLVNSGTVAAGTVNTNYSTDLQSVSVCALNSGGFVVVYNNTSGYLTLAKYDASGTQTIAPVATGYPYYYPNAAADANDNIYVIATQAVNGSYYPYIFKFSSSMVYQAQFYTGTYAGGAAYLTQPRITVSKGGNIGWMYNSSSTYTYFGIINSSMSYVSYAGNTLYAATSAGRVTLCPGPVSGFFVSFSYSSSSIYANFFSESGGSAGLFSITGSASNSGNYSGFILCPYYGSPTAHTYDATQNAAILYWVNSSALTPGSSYYYSIINSSSASVQNSGTISSVMWSTYSRYMNAVGNSAANYIIDYDTSGGYYKLQMVGNYDLSGTASVSISAASQTSYNNGYNLVGVAATTASAGSTGEVVINGVVALSSSYGTSSTPYAFNYNPQNISGSIGNKGSVVNRVVNLQGLQ